MGNHLAATPRSTTRSSASPALLLRYPLVDSQGNFGSIDDDPNRHALRQASRASPPRCSRTDNDTVDFGPNYDESKREPLVLPARFPNLLVNGSAGIAVGMATNMPPHNLAEVVNAVTAYIDNPSVSVEELMKHVKGPDFPTGAYVVGRSGIRDAYRTGRGRVVMRARAHIQEAPRRSQRDHHQRAALRQKKKAATPA